MQRRRALNVGSVGLTRYYAIPPLLAGWDVSARDTPEPPDAVAQKVEGQDYACTVK